LQIGVVHVTLFNRPLYFHAKDFAYSQEGKQQGGFFAVLLPYLNNMK